MELKADHEFIRMRFRILDGRGQRIGSIRKKRWRWSERVVWEILDPAGGVIVECHEPDLGNAVVRRVIGIGMPRDIEFRTMYGEVLATGKVAGSNTSLQLVMPQGGATHILDPRLVLGVGVLQLYYPW